MDKLVQVFESFKTYFTNDPKKIFTIVLCIAIVAVVIILVFYGVWLFLEFEHNKRIERNGVLLEILVKETSKIKDTENLIRNMHSLLLNTKFRKLIYGRPYLSFEIAADNEKLKFYVKAPKGYKDIVMERLYAAYPEIAIRETEDYLANRVWRNGFDIFRYILKLITIPIHKKFPKWPKNHLSIYGTEMELAFHHVLSIKNKMDNDIIGSILAGMKNLEWHEKVVVQILARPLDNTWQIKGRKILQKYETDGIRPKRGSDFSNFFGSLKEQLSDEINKEFDDFGSRSKVSKKTKMDRKEISGASDKLLEAGFETVIRVMAVGHYRKGSKSRVKGITAAFSELDKQNRFKRDFIFAKKLFYERIKARRIYLVDRQNILTTPELASFFLRLPGQELINELPEIEALRVKEFAPPKGIDPNGIVLAKNFYRGQEEIVRINPKDLTRHIITQGKTGSGKSEWIKSVLLDHIKRGLGLALFEPHGKLTDEFMELIPEERRKDVVYVDLFDPYIPGLNYCKVHKRKGVSYEDLVEKTFEDVVEILKRLFSESWSGKNQHYFENAIKTVIEIEGGNLLDIQRLFTDKEFRKYAVDKIKDPQVVHFWKTEFKENNKGEIPLATQNTVLSIMNKLGKFLNNKKILRAIAQEDCIDFKEIVDKNKILIFRLSKEQMTEDRIKFIGGVSIKMLITAAFQREKSQWNKPFILAIDEAQNFIDANIKTVLYELRKYGLSLVMMHQILQQMDEVPGLKEALYGNAGTTITFTVGEPDAPYFEKIYGPRVDQIDLKGLPSRYGYCKLLVNGDTSETFNIYTLDRPEVDKKTAKESVFEIKKNNRENRLHYKQIDKMIMERVQANKIEDYDVDENESFVEIFNDGVDTNIKLDEPPNSVFSHYDDEYPVENTVLSDDFQIKINNPYGVEDSMENNEVTAKKCDCEEGELKIKLKISDFYDYEAEKNKKNDFWKEADVLEKEEEHVKAEQNDNEVSSLWNLAKELENDK